MSSALLTSPLAVAGVLCANVVLSEWLARRGVFRHLGSALLVIVLTAVVANLRLIPTVSTEAMHPVYDGVFGYVAPLSIFWLLLRVDLREVARAGAQMVLLFLIGSLGVALGALAGMRLFGGGDVFGEHTGAIGGMFTGTYIGGSINFQAVALHYGVVENGLLFAGANAVDAALTTVWMAVTVVVPRLVAGAWPPLRALAQPSASALAEDEHERDREQVAPVDLALVVALGMGAVSLSDALAARTGAPSILILTTLALVAAQVPAVQRLRGYRSLGLFAIYVFLAVIGALCDLSAVASLGPLALRLTGLVLTVFAVHGVVLFTSARVLRLDPAAAAVASQAGVGGGTTALALARSLERPDLAAPGILVGSLGTALGTYLGFWVASVVV